MNLCSKPGCAHPGAAVLAYDYADRRAVIDDPPERDVSPHLYVLCAGCAGKMTPPRGWVLDDRRAAPPLFLDRAQERAEQRAEVEALPGPEPERRQQLFFGYSA